MEEVRPAVALPFRIGNSLRENPVEIARLQLITDAAATLRSDPMVDHVPAEERQEEAAEVVMMEEEGDGNGNGNGNGDGDGLGDRTTPGSEEEDTLSVGPEPSVASSISDSSSIASATDEFSSFDAYSETGTPSSVARPALTLSVGVPPAVAEPEVQGNQASSISGGGRSVFLTSYVPLWGRVSICGRRPEMEDAVVAVPRFFEIPLRMLTSDCFVDGMDSPTTNEPCTRRKTDGPFALFDIPSFIWLLIIFFFSEKGLSTGQGKSWARRRRRKDGSRGFNVDGFPGRKWRRRRRRRRRSSSRGEEERGVEDAGGPSIRFPCVGPSQSLLSQLERSHPLQLVRLSLSQSK